MSKVITRFVQSLIFLFLHILPAFLSVAFNKNGISSYKHIVTKKERDRDFENKRARNLYVERQKLETIVANRLLEYKYIISYEEDRDGIYIKWSDLGISERNQLDLLVDKLNIDSRHKRNEVNDILEFFVKSGGS